MSQQKKCPFCGRVIRLRDKFCPFCGRFVIDGNIPQGGHPGAAPGPYPTHQQRAPAPPASQPIPPAPPVTQPATRTQPAPFESTPSQTTEALSEEVIEQIALRVELEQLDQSMADIRSKLEELGEMISKIEVTEEVEQKIKTFKNKIKEIKVKREDLNAEKRDLPFDADLTKKKEIQDRLAKLNEAYRSKKVTESAFKKLRTEYEQQLQEIDTKSRSFKAKINTWIKQLKADRTRAQEQLELLEARQAAGELGHGAFDDKQRDLGGKIKRYNGTIKYLSARL